MKPRLLLITLTAVLGSGCSSLEKPQAALHIEPVLSIRHGAPNAQSYYQLGRYFHGQNRLNKAEKAYLKAVAVDHQHVYALNALGSLYAERGELQRASDMFRKVAAIAPNSAYLYNNLGYAYYLEGRLDEAYAAVLKALTLDQTLERGWVNLEHIAAARSDPALVKAAKSRRLEALPTDLAMQSNSPPPAAESTEIAREQFPSSEPGVSIQATSDINDHSMQLARLPVASSVEVIKVSVGPGLAIRSSSNEPAMSKGEKLNFVLASATREVVSTGRMIEIASADASAVPAVSARQILLKAARIEVSNGNGVDGFARKVSSQLRSNNMLVTRITNNPSFSVPKTEIQYDPRYEDTARALISKFNLAGRLIPAANHRAGVDIRIVLGRDAVQSSWQANAFNNSLNI